MNTLHLLFGITFVHTCFAIDNVRDRRVSVSFKIDYLTILEKILHTIINNINYIESMKNLGLEPELT